MPSNDFWDDLPKRSGPKPPTTQRADQAVSSTPIPKTPIQESASSSKPRRSPVRFLRLVLFIVGMVVAAGGGISFFLYQELTVKADESVTNPTVVEIQKGDSTSLIASQLENKGLIVSRWSFLLYIKLRHRDLRAGVYALNSAMTTREIADQIASGDVASYRVTIPEGWRMEQIADQLDHSGIVKRADFLAAAHYDSVRYTLPPGIDRAAGVSLEGLLFPDTYQFPYGVTSREIITKMLENFTKKTADLHPTNDQIILASIIEREAKFDADRPKIAGVYQNRLTHTIKLEADPTVQYARDTKVITQSDVSTLDKWWAPLTATDLKTASPYNTYLAGGLPPGPIANPGLKSLTAAVKPATSDKYYFLNLKDGTTIFAKTQDEQTANKKKYAAQF